MSIYYMGAIKDLPREMRQETEAFVLKGIPVFTADGIEKCHTVTLGTRQGEGVRLTVINLLADSGLDALFMQCNRQSQKAANLSVCDKAEIAITNGMGYVVLECGGEIVDEGQLKREKWEDWMAEYHPQGPASPDYVILRFVPHAIRAAF